MRIRIVFLLSTAVSAWFVLPASAQLASQPPVKSGQMARSEDGGVNEMMESIVVSANPRAPFTLLLETEWVRMLADGGTITLVNKRRIARDEAGRIYQERWFLVPKNGNIESEMTTVQISDPAAHTLYNCFFVGPKKNTGRTRPGDCVARDRLSPHPAPRRFAYGPPRRRKRATDRDLVIARRSAFPE